MDNKSPKQGSKQGGALAALQRMVPPVFLEAFTLTFLAEWGDRSQIATIGACRHAARAGTGRGLAGMPWQLCANLLAAPALPPHAGLAAAADVFGVTLGGILGHFMCTGEEATAAGAPADSACRRGARVPVHEEARVSPDRCAVRLGARRCGGHGRQAPGGAH